MAPFIPFYAEHATVTACLLELPLGGSTNIICWFQIMIVCLSWSKNRGNLKHISFVKFNLYEGQLSFHFRHFQQLHVICVNYMLRLLHVICAHGMSTHCKCESPCCILWSWIWLVRNNGHQNNFEILLHFTVY